MKTIKHIAILSVLALGGLITSCNGHDANGNVKEDSSAIEEARIEARNAARKFLNRPWRDTVELQAQLLEARALQSKYTQAGRPQSAAAFDSTFVSTLKTVRPEMAAELERAQANAKNNTPKQ